MSHAGGVGRSRPGAALYWRGRWRLVIQAHRQLRDGDYLGPLLNRAARVMAAGPAGKILASGSTAGVVDGADVGVHRTFPASSEMSLVDQQLKTLERRQRIHRATGGTVEAKWGDGEVEVVPL
jgi:class 3 adenylate cyclase